MSQIEYPAPGQVRIQGRLSSRFQGNLQYLLNLYENRKDWMLEPFQNRGRPWVIEPVRNKKAELAWAGEYAGKWLDAASLAGAGGPHSPLERYSSVFAAALVAAQEADGYLGIEAPAGRGEVSEWDNWNIKYAMTGLLTHYEVYHDRTSLDAAIKCGDWLIHRYGIVSGAEHPFFRSAMDGGVNASITDQVVRLYRCTGDRRFLDFASSIVTHFPPIVRMRESHQAPAWHAYNLAGYLGGVVSLAALDYREAELQWVEKVWEDLVERHLYPTGSIGFNELLQASAPNDTPVDGGQPERHHQETCATVEWLLLNASLYQATGNVRYLQRMEQTIYNALLSAQSEDGLSWMYFTPLRYEKRWFAGQTSCCYWSGPRGLARLPEWVFALDEEGIRVNLFEACEAAIKVGGYPVVIQQSCLYPDSGRIAITVRPENPLRFTLRLRIPFPGYETKIRLNGHPVPVEPGLDGYFRVDRQWSTGDQIVMEFDIPSTLRNFLGNQYGILERGAEVLAVDQRDNPSLDLDQVVLHRGITINNYEPANGRRLYLGEVYVDDRLAPVIFTPYADCGGKGSRFRTAFPVLER
jgi:DUF1680 family protein